MTPFQRVTKKYKLIELQKLQRNFTAPLDPKNYPFIGDTLSAFNVNMKRVHGILFNGPYNLQFGVLGGISSCSSAGEATNYRTILWWDTENPDSLTLPQLQIAHRNFVEHYAKIEKHARTTQGQKAFGNLSDILFGYLLSVEDQPAHHGFEAALAAALIGAWTAFEILAGDLWEYVVNQRLILAFIALDAEPNRKDSIETREKKSKKTVDLLLQKVKDPDFDIRSQMGTLLRQSDEFSFLKRTRARDAFLKIFPKSKAEIKAIFDADMVRWLGATRNILVHKGGIVDQEFHNQVSDHPELKRIKRGAIPLDCKIVADLVTGIISKSGELLMFVNDWMKSNPANYVTRKKRSSS